MAGRLRRPLLDAVFRAMARSFDRRRAEGVEAVVDFDVGGRRDGLPDHYRLLIADGCCKATRWRGDDADLTLTIDAAPFLRLVAGGASAERLLVAGRLDVSGDVVLAMRLPRLFRRPRPH